jgi:hypothetical protein
MRVHGKISCVCPCTFSREKFEELKLKEKELAAFMDDFPHKRAAKLAELSGAQDAIVAAMERLSKLNSLAGGAMPSKGQFQDMQVRQ